MLRPCLVSLVLLVLGAAAVSAQGEPETIGGRDQVWWSTQAHAHEGAIERLERELAACEEREAPPAYQSVPAQIYRGRDGQKVREPVRCDDLRDDLAAAHQAQDGFEELARRLGVPPGWLR